MRNVLTVIAGSAAAQAVGFALTPVLSRLFSPVDFGLFGSFTAVTSVILAGVTLEYTQAIMLPKERDDAINLFFVASLATVLIAALCLVVCLILPKQMLGLLHTDKSWMLGLLIVAIFVGGINRACQAWATRTKAFKHVSASQVIRSLSSSGVQIGAGYLHSGPAGLVGGAVTADFLASANLGRIVYKDYHQLRGAVSWARIRQLAKEYRDFPMYSASQNVTNSLSTSIPLLLLIHHYGAATAGAYAFASRILWTPLSLLVGSLRQVLFQKAAESQHRGRSLVSLYVRTTAGLFAIGVVPAMIIFCFGPWLFSSIFGARWMMAGTFARSLMLWLLFVFCNLPAVLFARLIRIQRTVFFYDLALLVARVLVLAIGGLYLSAGNAIMLFSVVGAVMNCLLIFLVGHAVMRKEGEVNLSRLGQHLFGQRFTRRFRKVYLGDESAAPLDTSLREEL